MDANCTMPPSPYVLFILIISCQERVISLNKYKYVLIEVPNYSSIFQKHIKNNECTGTYFKVEGKDHFICFALKSGSTSWQVFFAENQIKTAYIADCAKNSTCPKFPEVRILQVRHPFERLLSTYRHLFKNGGWKSLELNKDEKEIEDTLTLMFSKTWQEFIDDVIIKNQLFISEENLNDLNHPGTWLKTHWAPFWQTCGVCDFGSDLEPGFILKTETLEWDVPEVLSALGMKRDILFPDIRVTGNDDNFSEGNRVSTEFVGKYFSQLTKRQILELYEIYKTDFIMFDYSPDQYFELARNK